MKKGITVILLIAVCLYGYFSYINFKEKSLFKIADVKVITENQKLVKDLIKSLENYKGKNILKIDKKQLKEALKNDIRIDKVTIKRQLPDVLVINLEEKQPFAYIEYEEKIYLSSEKGKIYGFINETQKYELPFFRVKKTTEIKDLIEIFKKVDFKEEISQMYSIENGVVITTNSGLKIITNVKVEQKKYLVIKNLILNEKQKHKKYKKIEYIDLRFEDYIIKNRGD